MLPDKNIPFSRHDKEVKEIRLPSGLTCDLAEEIGIHIGDGSMNKYTSYMYSLRGGRHEEEYYVSHISSLYKDLYNLDVNIRKWPDVIGFQIGSKAICLFKNRVLGLPLGPKDDIIIPSPVVQDDSLSKSCIRGIFDTDGCIYIGNDNYPRIEVATTSIALHKQLKTIIERDFNLSSWNIKYTRKRWKPLFKIAVRGHENIVKWFNIIGSNNPKNLEKFEDYRAAVA